MVWVNLLPWRQAALRKRWRVWRLAIALLLLVLLTLSLNGHWQRRLNAQQIITLERGSMALNAARELSAQLHAAQQQLEKLQRQQERMQQRQQQMGVWHAFARTLGARFPPDVWLNVLHKTRQSLVLRGVATDIQSLHQLRDRLREVTLFGQVTLGSVQRVRRGEMTFDIQAAPLSSAGTRE